MSKVSSVGQRVSSQNWRRLRPVTILVTDEEYAALEKMLGREPRSLNHLAEFLTKPSVIEGTWSGDTPTPG